MDQINLGLDEGWVHFSGAQDELQAILLAVPLHRLPLMTPAQKDLVGLTPRGTVCISLRRICGR
jgi:hypothetical protein